MTDDILDQLEDEIESLCEGSDDPACDTLEDAVETLSEERDLEPLTYREFTKGKHSYRGYSPRMVERLIDTVGIEGFEGDTDVTAIDGIRYMESGRWADALEETSQMFNRLDDDERKLFTQRNPDLVEWVTVYDEANGYEPQLRWREMARANLSGGDDGRREAKDPPLFGRQRGSVQRPVDDLLRSLYTRRRSYRNFTPQEFQEILGDDKIEVSAGMAREIGLRTAEIRSELEFPIMVYRDEVVRALLDRVESGRFAPMLSELANFYVRLDIDERRMFSRRNPGIVMWISVYGEANHMPHGKQLKAHTYPTLPEG